ncbi:response regulator [Faunimonas sp. B44]|uniref:response regulator n=1 Tax=Faunimonas sp. B44 TaxID=3461493 RepID=UPI004044F401
MNEDACVLILEADVLVRQPLAEYLRGCGYRVLEAASADEARVHLARGSRSVDLLLANPAGFGGAGFALATWTRAVFPDIDIVLVGSVEKAAETAGKLCADGADKARADGHRLVLDRIRRLRAARDRNGHSE